MSFAVFILTHGRPDNVITYKTLKDCGYTGDIFLIVDDQDKTMAQYVERFGDKVVVFSKKEIAKTFDTADNFTDMRSIVYARNASFQIAKTMGLKHFVQLDDDYSNFYYKFDKNSMFKNKRIVKNLDNIFEIILGFLVESGASSVAMAQQGDFIGGVESSHGGQPKLTRKCMNSFFCSTDRPFQFLGRINEDVNTYTRQGSTGLILFTMNHLALTQKATQASSGGMTELYLDSGTYVKSFYSVMFMPSAVKVSVMKTNNGRLHHSIRWDNTVPKIVSEKHKKK